MDTLGGLMQSEAAHYAAFDERANKGLLIRIYRFYLTDPPDLSQVDKIISYAMSQGRAGAAAIYGDPEVYARYKAFLGNVRGVFTDGVYAVQMETGQDEIKPRQLWDYLAGRGLLTSQQANLLFWTLGMTENGIVDTGLGYRLRS